MILPLRLRVRALLLFSLPLLPAIGSAAQAPAAAPAKKHYVPSPAFDAAAMDKTADPCNDFYQYACGNYAARHPIPADQSSVDQFYESDNVNSERLDALLAKLAAGGAGRTPLEAKLGNAYGACMDTAMIEKKDLAPLQPLLDQVDRVTKPGLPYFVGELQRYGVNALFGFGEMQDFKDATRQIAVFDQGGLGLPERDYYTRTGEKDKQLREQYVRHLTNMLSFAGEPPQQALRDARDVLAFETKLAEASMDVTTRRDPENVYHPQTLKEFDSTLHGVPFGPFLEAVHAPKLGPGERLNNANPKYFPAMVQAVLDANTQTLRAYLRVRIVDTFSRVLPKRFDAEHFDFYSRKLRGQPEDRARWQICTFGVDNALGEALGQVYVQKYFAGDSKAKTLEMVHDIEAAMDRDIDTLDWMGAATKLRAKEKLHAVADKIGYPDKWRDYGALQIAGDDALGNLQRANAFENDRQLAKIGKPIDRSEWSMTPPTVNAYYDPSMNNINFPAGILQPAFYDPAADIAVNYGHIGAVIGHELTHGFDDQGKKFDAKGNLADWWTAEDTKKFEARTSCVVKEYGGFTAVDDVKVNGALTLGENTADNGGLLLAYMAYLDRAKKTGQDSTAKINGFTGPQRFYIAYAQNWCENARPEQVRQQVLTNEHAPGHFRANGAIVNQPGFSPAFGCKRGAPMAPADSCRVW